MFLLDHIQIAAIHEAGHVVMRHQSGLRTPHVVVWPDGTGLTVGTGVLIHDVTTRLDTTLAGAIAELKWLGEDEIFPPSEIRDLLQDYHVDEFRSLIDEDEIGDYEEAIQIAKWTHARWSDDEVVEAIASSVARCLDLLGSRWSDVIELGEAIRSHPKCALNWEEIVAVIGPTTDRWSTAT